MHGTDVLYSAVETQKIREALLQIKTPERYRVQAFTEWEANIRRVYGPAAEGVLALQKKLGWYEEDRYPLYQEKWQQIKEVLKEVPSSGQLMEYVESIGLDTKEFEKTYGKKKIEDAIWYAKDLKDRFTVLWVNYDLKR